jgi:hypothetical protein
MGYGTWGGTFEGQRSGEVDRVAVQDVACHNGHCTVLARWTRVKGAVRMMTVHTGLEVGQPTAWDYSSKVRDRDWTEVCADLEPDDLITLIWGSSDRRK